MKDPHSAFFRAGAALEARRIDEALAELTIAEQGGFDLDQCAAARWDCWMFLGHFDRAWAESTAIAARGNPDPHRFWNGEALENKHVILRCLHGLGDTIQFIRYAPMIRAIASSLVVEAHPELTRLLECVQGIDQVVTWGADSPAIVPHWDTQIEVTELPRLFATTVNSIPANIPYIQLPRRSQHLSRRERRRVGVVWSSSQWNPARSVPVELLASTLNALDWEVFSLQHGPDRHRFPALRSEGDVLDTALDMQDLDLIVSADTMAAHLAGALARPVWVLLPFEADWRWMLERSDSPWYPTMTLFRQDSPGDWESALRKLHRAALAF